MARREADVSDVLSLLEVFCLSLGLTLVLEAAIAILFKLKSEELCLFLLVNLLTNPAAVYLNLVLCSFFPYISVFAWQIPTELAVIGIEGLIYSKRSRSLRMPWLFAAVANVFSYSIGLIIDMII